MKYKARQGRVERSALTKKGSSELRKSELPHHPKNAESLFSLMSLLLKYFDPNRAAASRSLPVALSHTLRIFSSSES